MRLLFFHHNRPHFETFLALYTNCRKEWVCDLWSDQLDVFGRREIVEKLGINAYDPSKDYAAIVIISGDYGIETARRVPAELSALLMKRPTIHIRHRYKSDEEQQSLYLFPRARSLFIPVTTGLEETISIAERISAPRRLLIQGNIEPRRDYSTVHKIADQFPECEINIVGIKTEFKIPEHPRINISTNVDEIVFHKICHFSSFIIPMIDPKKHWSYYHEVFTSSIQMGIAYSLPFIAHEKLFDLYPICGWAYNSTDNFDIAVSNALSCSQEQYKNLIVQTEKEKLKIF